MAASKRRTGRGGGRQQGASSALARLADQVGIVREYLDQTGKETRVTSDETRAALLGAMGIEAVADDAAARQALAQREAEDAGRAIPAVRVLVAGDEKGMRAARAATLPDDWPASSPVEALLEVTGEDGETRRARGRFRATRRRGVLPEIKGLDPGYYRVRLTLRAKGRALTNQQTLIVVPPSCPTPRELLGGRRVFGVIANLYTVRSERNWGVGDFTDLAALAEWAGGEGAAFVGLNPLHTLRNRDGDVSPYSPVSRLFRNPLYLDVEAVPELSESRDAQSLVNDRALLEQLRTLRAGDRVDYEAVMRLKTPVLEVLHRVFAARHRDGTTDRGRLYAAFVADQGQLLTDFATFLALEEEFSGKGDGGRGMNSLGTSRGTPSPFPLPSSPPSWREWPEEYRDPASPAVSRFRDEHAERVDFHRWVQFELDTQLRAAAERGRRAGMPVGLYQDLAIGTSPNGADPWLFPGLFLQGASVGAPPDPFASEGQNWGLPPLDPRRLAADGYRYWIQLVRSALRHSGALRIDHIVGLFRQFWIPEGMSGKKGAYVRFPSEELLGILALESSRAGALVVGEDLGTVPPDVPDALERWGVLSSKVLWFEQDAKKRFRPAAEYPARSLATANTHDLATIAGFWTARDVELRAEHGLLGSKRAAATARKERERDREALLERLVDEGLLPEDADRDDVDALELRHAVHAFLRRTPAWLVGFSLDDLAGETDAVNLPGVGPDKFPSWTRKQSMSLEELRESAAVRYALGVERAWAKPGGDNGEESTA